MSSDAGYRIQRGQRNTGREKSKKGERQKHYRKCTKETSEQVIVLQHLEEGRVRGQGEKRAWFGECIVGTSA